MYFIGMLVAVEFIAKVGKQYFGSAITRMIRHMARMTTSMTMFSTFRALGFFFFKKSPMNSTLTNSCFKAARPTPKATM